ncbi:acetylcholinesterase-like [Saccoglossus kowalevskii]|uniref:Carboxylic ester hydrolase n=1 Tax=Saccoglossus kowalevskii TaxID=10224 RepID=A0ABM0MZB9_SACKO|nr:PREDICTED: acetylcholinesterase-like [Saccoglossus kowalevskii]
MLSLSTVFVVIVLITTACNADRPTVEISTGTLIGTVEEFSSEFVDGTRTVHVYRGIPYAEPPVGDLRFAPPKPKTPWQGEYDAADFRTACIQPETPPIPTDKIQDEDCLHLNVYAPQPRKDNTPVMFWIHGGAFIMGSGTRMYDATILSSLNDVIVVTINYRLGALGFLSTGDDVAPGNYGFLDQVEALRWVQQNIAAFGGDPNTVTLFGESAGAMSAHYHVMSPMSKGLFKRSILQSGTGVINGVLHTDTSKTNKIAHGQGKLVGCEKDNSKELIECLRTVPADEFRDSSDVTKRTIANVTGINDITMPFQPTLDGEFIKEDPSTIRTFNGEELMTGTTGDEGLFFFFSLFPNDDSELSVNKTLYDSMFSMVIPGKNQAVLDMIKLIYVDWDHADEENANYLSPLSQMAGDVFFVCPSDVAARDYYGAGLNTYMYQLTHAPAKSVWPFKTGKPLHGDDILFVFGYALLSEMQLVLGGDEKTLYKQTPNEIDIQVSLQTMKYWTNFAKTGNPNRSSASDEDNNDDWPLFTVPGLAYKQLSLSMENSNALKARECAFWNQFEPKLQKFGETCGAKEESKYSEEANTP